MRLKSGIPWDIIGGDNMIKYLNISNFEVVENFLLSHPDEPFETRNFRYWLHPVGECAMLLRQAKNNSEGHIKGSTGIIAYYNKGDLE